MNFEIFLVAVTILYALQTGIFLLGLRRAKDERHHVQPSVTVVIAARNEEEHIGACLSSALNQTYSREKFTVVVANDNSSDRTGAICTELASTHSHLTIFDVLEEPPLRGKSNALAQAIDRATGEIILITDADCVVPTTWVEETAKRYGDPSVGLVGGITLQESTTAFSGVQSLDWALILGVAAATAAWGNLLGSIGNNLSFRRRAYEEVGGYRNIPFSITEDYALVQAIATTKRWKYLYPIDEKLLVVSKPCPDLASLVRQKHRWGKGGLDMKLSGFVLLIVTGLMHLSPFIILYWGKFVLASACVMVKFTADYLFLHALLRRLRRTEELQHFFWFELYYSLYVFVMPVLARFGGDVVWKGRRY